MRAVAIDPYIVNIICKGPKVRPRDPGVVTAAIYMFVNFNFATSLKYMYWTAYDYTTFKEFFFYISLSFAIKENSFVLFIEYLLRPCPFLYQVITKKIFFSYTKVEFFRLLSYVEKVSVPEELDVGTAGQAGHADVLDVPCAKHNKNKRTYVFALVLLSIFSLKVIRKFF